MQLFSCIRRFLASDDGPTAVEYAVLLSLIIIVSFVAVTTLGTSTNGTFNKVANSMPSAQQTTGGTPSQHASAVP